VVEDGAHEQMSFLFCQTRQKRPGIVKLRVIRSGSHFDAIIDSVKPIFTQWAEVWSPDP